MTISDNVSPLCTSEAKRVLIILSATLKVGIRSHPPQRPEVRVATHIAAVIVIASTEIEAGILEIENCGAE